MKNYDQNDFFFETFFLYFKDTRKFRYRLKTHPFSIIEMRLLESFQSYRKNMHNRVLEVLNSFTANPIEMEGMRLFILGMTYNQLGSYHKAEPLLKSSMAILDKIENKRVPFFVCSVIVINLANQRKKDEISYFVDKMFSYPLSTTEEQIQRYQAQLASFVVFEKAQEGVALIEKIMLEFKDEIDTHIPFYLTMYFMFCFQMKDYQKCFQINERYKKYKGCKVKVNHIFQKTMLEHIVNDLPLYIYDKDFASDSTLHKQALIARHLSVGEIEYARKYWNQLEQAYPHLYGKDFNYLGEWGLFAAVIDKHLHKAMHAIIDLDTVRNIKKVEAKIIYILENSLRPVSKEDLIKYVWDEVIDEVNSERLYKQMSRLRKKYPGSIATSQGMYWFDKKAG